MKKRNRTKIMCMFMMLALLLSGIHFPTAKAATTESQPVIGGGEAW